MCELFGMSSKFKTNVNMSLAEFSRHGGQTNHHKHGWGIAYYEDNDVRLIKETDAASHSAHMEFMKTHNYQSSVVISHIRHATQGAVKLANTQPFDRELRGKRYVFAHNGNLEGLSADNLVRFQPVGETDSEKAFCLILEMISGHDKETSLLESMPTVHDLAHELAKRGPFNFLLCDSEYLLVHGDRRTQADYEITAPGLHYLCRHCPIESSIERDQHIEIPGLEIPMTPRQEVVLIASVPLSDEEWVRLGEGETLLFRHGKLLKKLS